MRLQLVTVRKRIFGHFPMVSFIVLALWVTIGLINLYSATYRLQAEGVSPLFRSQLIWIGLGILLLLFTTFFDYHWLFEAAYPLYGFSLFLLSLVFVFGKSVAGQQNWIALGGFSFQPSEIAQLGLVLALAKYYSTRSEKPFSFFNLLAPFALFLAPFLLVVIQKDLGGSLFFILIFVSLTVCMNVNKRLYIFALILALAGGFMLYQYGLKPYQKDRVRLFMNPESDPRGKGYHLMQSKIAVGSGGILGKGYLKGSINKLKYLPERHTDFIFSVFAEEWGLMGGVVVIVLFALFLLLGIEIAAHAKEPFGALLAFGIVALFFWHMAINLGGVLGLLPLTGVPLPLMSYGGSSILTSLLSIGILFNVRMRRFSF